MFKLWLRWTDAFDYCKSTFTAQPAWVHANVVVIDRTKPLENTNSRRDFFFCSLKLVSFFIDSYWPCLLTNKTTVRSRGLRSTRHAWLQQNDCASRIRIVTVHGWSPFRTIASRVSRTSQCSKSNQKHKDLNYTDHRSVNRDIFPWHGIYLWKS